MEKGALALSDVIHHNKYAKYLADLKRRETYEETVDRYINMMTERYPDLSDSIKLFSESIYKREILPSMRALQFAGEAVNKNESRIYNCSFLPIDDYRAFSEVMFLLLGGTGVGFSVQQHHVDRLPEIRKPQAQQKYVIADSIEGWADAVKHLMKAYFGKRETKPRFDYSSIRAKGERLKTAGGKAPGPEPLKTCLFNIETILERKEEGDKLNTVEVYDIVCHIANAVLAGGIRRAALIALFSPDDEAMLSCKAGKYWDLNPQRGRANNSAVLLRSKEELKEDFERIFKITEKNKTGEPGIYFTNDLEWGTNPCAEIGLRAFQFCNLCEINVSDVKTQTELDKRVIAATFFGTLQAGFTDFHYLRPIWSRTTKKDALVGIGMTGIADGNAADLDLTLSAKIAVETNTMVAKEIGINPAARVTTVKPAGTTSTLLGTSSGIHTRHSDYYIRNVQCAIGDDLYRHFSEHHPALIKEMDDQPGSAVIGFPVKSPEGAITREGETAIEFLNRVAVFNTQWVAGGHVSGPNTNNVSATVSVRDSEWGDVADWMWSNRDSFNGLSVLPYTDHVYKDAPFMECTKEEYEEKLSHIDDVDMTLLIEEEDNTDQRGEIACAGGSCEML